MRLSDYSTIRPPDYFDPYGNPISQSGVGTTAYGFAGEWTDATGLEYLRARYYSALQGRFVSRDVWEGDDQRPQSLNGWSYAEGNPVNGVDPSGHDPWWCDSQPDPQQCRESYLKIATDLLHAQNKTAYLTFDDGPDPAHTPRIGQKLQDKGAQATFFVIGTDPNWARLEESKCNASPVPPEWIGEPVVGFLKAAGHAVGIHGWLHENKWTKVDPAQEVRRVEEVFEKLGVSPDPLLRAPFGEFPTNPVKGYEQWYYYGWNIDAEDRAGVGKDAIIKNVKSQLEAKGRPENPIIVLHSIFQGTEDAIASDNGLLEELGKLGYRWFRKLPRPGDHAGYPPIWP